MRFKLNLFILILLIKLTKQSKDKYTESVLIKPLQEGHVYSYFQFKTISDTNINDIYWVDHFDYFPLTIAKILSKHKVQELHFSLTKGLWKHNLWGYPIRDAANGAELAVYFQSIQEQPSKAWNELTSLLSGHFCASINFIDNAATVNPIYSFNPSGVTENGTFDHNLFYYASLPHESVCTENLTPWKKLLPCFAKTGLSSLLNARQLFNSNYFSIALDIRPICRDPECSTTSIELKQTLSVVFNPPFLFDGYKQSWSILKLFGSPLKEYCHLADESEIIVDITSNYSNNLHTLSFKPSSIETIDLKNEKRTFALYNLKDILNNLNHLNLSKFNVASLYKDKHIYSEPVSPIIHVSRYITGYGVSTGGITCQIHNKNGEDLKIAYLDIIPWYLRIYVHTLTISSSSKQKIDIEKFHYKPAIDRRQPHHLELIFDLPANSITTIEFSFERQYLKWTEYPPDANHGVYAGAAIVTVSLPDFRNLTLLPRKNTENNINENIIRIHTPTLLISLATPDFTMPYNVICLVSTVITLAFGPIYNLTTRRPQKAEKKEKKMFSFLLFWKKDKSTSTSVDKKDQ